MGIERAAGAEGKGLITMMKVRATVDNMGSMETILIPPPAPPAGHVAKLKGSIIMKTENHTRSTLGRTSLLLAASVAAVLLQTGAVMAADSPRERISINNDWRFTKNDPAGITDNLAYPRSAGGGGGGEAKAASIHFEGGGYTYR